MEISKAKKLQREAQMQIDEIVNELAKKTSCHLKIDFDIVQNLGDNVPTYLSDITLML